MIRMRENLINKHVTPQNKPHCLNKIKLFLLWGYFKVFFLEKQKKEGG